MCSYRGELSWNPLQPWRERGAPKDGNTKKGTNVIFDEIYVWQDVWRFKDLGKNRESRKCHLQISHLSPIRFHSVWHWCYVMCKERTNVVTLSVKCPSTQIASAGRAQETSKTTLKDRRKPTLTALTNENVTIAIYNSFKGFFAYNGTLCMQTASTTVHAHTPCIQLLPRVMPIPFHSRKTSWLLGSVHSSGEVYSTWTGQKSQLHVYCAM